MPTYSFRADMVFAVSTTSLCWVDLRTGILVCDHIDTLAAGTDDDDRLVFRFIPLPKECAMEHDLLSRERLAEEYRTMICMDPETILFACMDGYIKGLPIGDTVLTTWTLKFPLTNHWTWQKHSAPSLCMGDLLDNLPISKDDSKKLLHIASSPVISINSQNLAVTNLTVTEFEWKHQRGKWEVTGLYELSIDMYSGNFLEWSALGSRYSQIFAADINRCLEEKMNRLSVQPTHSALKVLSREEVDKDEWPHGQT
uniref:DUF1618 domain-containing protein n=1 Tax=Oryza punctata TaxID=4537 RepID=A0A0E0JUJ8_ORYPU